MGGEVRSKEVMGQYKMTKEETQQDKMKQEGRRGVRRRRGNQ